MMSIQLKIWKRLISNQTPLGSQYVSKAMSLLPSLAIYAKPHLKFLSFCTETEVTSTIPRERGVVTEFLLNKCNLTEEDITKAYKHDSHLLRVKSAQNCEEALELLNGCGLTTPAQIRKVTLCNPKIFFYRSERNIKSKLSFFRTFMKEDDIAKLLYRNARVIKLSEDRLNSAVALVRKLGFDDEALSKLLTKQPHLLISLEKDVMESFQNAADMGFKKGSKMFANALRALTGIGKEKLDRRRLCFSNLGFSQKQISKFLRKFPVLLSLSEESVKRKVHFLANSGGLSLDDIAKYPVLFLLSLEKRIIPRFRVVEALKSMQMLETEMSSLPIVLLTEKSFLKKYVHSNAECSSVQLDIYRGGKV